MRTVLLVFLALPLLLQGSALAQLNAGPNDLYIRVVDNGPGLCAIVKLPDRHYMVYDTGHWQQNHLCVSAAEEIIGGDPIDLMIISHSDGDHIADGDDILNKFKVRQIIRTGFRREDTTGWNNLNNAIGDEAKQDATVINLQTTTLVPGTRLAIGPAILTLVFGLGQWTATPLGESESRNAISIVVRLEYQGSAVLFAGDTVGRRIGAPSSACDDAEAMMVTNHNKTGSDRVPLNSDIIIAPHHGADNASSTCFIAAVNLSFVVFPAGHAFQHPRENAAQRYLDHGIAESNMFRTDRGDDEGTEEWEFDRISGCQDKKGDDDVEVVIAQDGSVAVEYRQQPSGC